MEIRFWVGDVLKNYLEVSGWWRHYRMPAPPLDMMPEESTLFWEVQGKLAYTVTVFLTNSPVAWVDNYVSNPSLSRAERRLLSSRTVQDLQKFLREKNYKKALAMSLRDSTDKTYERLGFRKTAQGITTFLLEE